MYSFRHNYMFLLCLWFRASLIYINNCPTRCNTKQSIILEIHSTCFGCRPHPSSGVHKTVTTASGTVQLPHSNVAKLPMPRWREGAAQKIWPVPEAVDTVLCTPDDGSGWHPKHVKWTCRIINRLLCVASLWAIINITICLFYYYCTIGYKFRSQKANIRPIFTKKNVKTSLHIVHKRQLYGIPFTVISSLVIIVKIIMNVNGIP